MHRLKVADRVVLVLLGVVAHRLHVVGTGCESRERIIADDCQPAAVGVECGLADVLAAAWLRSGGRWRRRCSRHRARPVVVVKDGLLRVVSMCVMLPAGIVGVAQVLHDGRIIEELMPPGR